MVSTNEKYQKRRLRSSYLSVIVSVALVLFLVGILGIIVLKTRELAQHFKEQMTLNIFLKNTENQDAIADFRKALRKKTYTKDLTYTSKEDAANMMQKEIGQDFMEFLGTNPLKDVLAIQLKSNYVTTDSIQKINKELSENSVVYDISYDKPLIELLNRNIKRISIWLLAFSTLMTLIAVMLINSSIRLSVYSKRFIIKTMQMVGATKKFIRRPFIWNNIKLGILGALLAILALIGVSLYIEKQVPEINMLDNWQVLGVVFAVVLILGILISWVSTYFATRRFLNLRTDQLYY